MGSLDLVMLRYALRCVGKLDQLAVTCLDRLPADRPIEICRTHRACTAIEPAPLVRDLAYQTALTHKLMQETPILEYVPNREELPTLLEDELHLPVSIRSYGPTAAEKVDKTIEKPQRGDSA